LQLFATQQFRGGFDIVTASKLAQAVMMTLPAGRASDDEPSNEHPRCEQWLLVLGGSGVALSGSKTMNSRRIRLQPGSLLVIRRGESHQIKNTGRVPLRTMNFYVPPAYQASGEPKPSAKSSSKGK
jgi:mannose-6-phosphate isomerase-like protein (cupin superfamily)